MMTLSEIIKHVSYHSPSLRQSPSLCQTLQQWTFIFFFDILYLFIFIEINNNIMDIYKSAH